MDHNVNDNMYVYLLRVHGVCSRPMYFDVCHESKTNQILDTDIRYKLFIQVLKLKRKQVPDLRSI